MVAENAPLTLRAVKLTTAQLVRDGAERDMAAAKAAIAACFASDDHLEGARAFMQKRTPVFTGR
jgi:enoyl-CoA hydratase/carnithine racemase